MSRLVRAFFLVFCLAFPCWAQVETLLIGSGDILAVKVLEAPELNQSARVTDAGELPLILGGTVNVSGLTPAQAADVIQCVLKKGKFMLNPHVAVTIEQFATQNVSVLGQVKSPGAYPLATPRTVLDVLAKAGGLSELADRRITIERQGSKQHIEYFVSNKANLLLDTNVLVYPGDLVIVPKAEVVYVLGDVGHPGGYAKTTNDSNLSVLQAVAMAGGTQPNARPSQTRLIRKKTDGTFEDIKLPLSEMQKGKKPDMALQADDVLYVPFSYSRNIALAAGALVAGAASATIYHF